MPLQGTPPFCTYALMRYCAHVSAMFSCHVCELYSKCLIKVFFFLTNVCLNICQTCSNCLGPKCLLTFGPKCLLNSCQTVSNCLGPKCLLNIWQTFFKKDPHSIVEPERPRTLQM